MKPIIIGVLQSGNAFFLNQLHQVAIVGADQWNCFFDTGIVNETPSVTGTQNVDSTLKSAGSGGTVIANVSCSSTSQDGTVTWRKNGIPVNSYGFLRSTSPSSNYTFTGCNKGDILLVEITPAVYDGYLQAEAVTSGEDWYADFNSVKQLHTVGIAIDTGPVPSTSGTPQEVVVDVWYETRGVTNAIDVWQVRWEVNGSLWDTESGIAGAPIDVTRTITGLIPGDSIEVYVNQG